MHFHPSLPSGRTRERSMKTVLYTWSAQKMVNSETEWFFFFCYLVTTNAPEERSARTLKKQEAFGKEAPQQKDTSKSLITLATRSIQHIWTQMQQQPPVASLTFKRRAAVLSWIVWQSPSGWLELEETTHHCRRWATNSFWTTVWLTCFISRPCTESSRLLQVLLFLPNLAFSIEGSANLALHMASVVGITRQK